ncbi:MAG: radical SAM protein [Anaerolineae bacterium]
MGRSFRVGLISPYSNIAAMGLRQISACLKVAGWDTRLIFLPDAAGRVYASRPHPQDYPPALLEQVCDLCSDVDLVGISVMSSFVGRARALTRAIHERLSLPVVWGGVHPTIRPAECLAWADLVCVGEGEGAMVELVRRMAAGQGHAHVPNIWSKDADGRVTSNPVCPLNGSLDDLPFPDYDLGHQYVLHQDQVTPLTPELLAYCLLDHFVDGVRVVYMTCMTRGCPYRCAYCSANVMAQAYPERLKLRRNSPEYTVAKINALRRLVPSLQAVKFLDDAFLTASSDEIGHFSALYREQVGLPFKIMVAPGAVSEKKIRCLVEAGLQDVEMGIQAGSQRMRVLFRRPESESQVLAAAACLNRFQAAIPRPSYDVISDNPYETQADQLESLRLFYRLPRPHKLNLFSLTFFPDTPLYRQARADGLIQDDERDVYPKNFAQMKPTYYNFVLWCLRRNLPRWLLWPLIQPLALRVLGGPRMTWPFRLLWRGINRLRVWQARRHYLAQLSRLKGGQNVTA